MLCRIITIPLHGYGSYSSFWSWCSLGVGVPALVSLAGAVLVAAPFQPVQTVGPVPPGSRDDDVAQEPQQLQDGDRDQPGVRALRWPLAGAARRPRRRNRGRPAGRSRSSGAQDFQRITCPASRPTANKATEAALAAYPGGVVDRVVELSNGGYEVHYIGVNWPHHIFVNQDFKVIGAND
jgi:hypothetical protein